MGKGIRESCFRPKSGLCSCEFLLLQELLECFHCDRTWPQMLEPLPQSATELIEKWKTGDQEAIKALFPLIYRELRSAAHWYMRGERPGHTLQTTALVHEAYLRLAQQGPFQTQSRE